MKERILNWKKSSFSGGDNGDCVQLAWAGGIRDSKNPEADLRIDIAGLVSAVKAGRLTR